MTDPHNSEPTAVEDASSRDAQQERVMHIMRGCSFAVSGVTPVSVAVMLLVSAPLWICGCLIMLALIGHLMGIHLRRGGNVEVAMHTALMLTLVGVILPMFGLGGIAAPGKAWIVIVPVFAGLVGGARTAVAYTIVSVLGLGMVAAADTLHLTQAPPLTPRVSAAFDLFQTGMVTAVVLFLVASFTAAQRRAERNLRLLNGQLAESRDIARAATAAKAEFLANMSHEIRTPMNGVIGMTTLLLDTPLNQTQREYADTTQKSALALLGIVNDILDLSKIEAGKLEVEHIATDLRACIEEVAAVLAFQAAPKGIELIVDIDPRLPRTVMTDPVRLRQCLSNLLSNAIKFTAVGEVVLTVAPAGTAGGEVTYSVRDTGIGIPPDKLAKLFAPFAQADGSTTRRFGGTGLGLSIVKHLAELMNGSVGVRSIVGAGSEFWFRLPLSAAPETQSAALPPSMQRAARILVVADNATNLEVLSRHLALASHRVATRRCGKDALEALQAAAQAEQPFELVICDQRLPDMSGAELARCLHQQPEFASARLLLLVTVDQLQQGAALAAEGISASLTKPVRLSRLTESIAAALDDARELPQRVEPDALITPPSGKYQGTVLVVEDNKVNQKVAQRLLERMGLRVALADNGELGVQAYAAGGMDLILMDVQMPVLDGYAATRRIRELERSTGTHIPIVALTADAMSQHLEMCREAGMDAYLSKPIELAQLHAVLRPALGEGARETAAS